MDPNAINNALDYLTGKKKVSIQADLPTVKVEMTEETTKTVKAAATILAGALIFVAISNLVKRK